MTRDQPVTACLKPGQGKKRPAPSSSSSSPSYFNPPHTGPRATPAHIPALECRNHRGYDHPPRRESIRQRRRVD
ncbi:hypothetical protein HBI81_185240 [Parastagonospora nodorum]|nr:hypothetical protein HBH46_174100 [Parastagonospora nodorum]KAH4957362.1 hypothetical protein HBI78_189900 [Parastagonospora nodorum]KAH5469062.1 hypothetical protein HBI31_197320 [Parastagonospora nodorum]KAH5716662.1 hypothetical protein HBI18_181390 [Parastagonospora nodorum]KAH6330378.1 hypothetical protein HBI37_188370 [Parastagonospora nodorum]